MLLSYLPNAHELSGAAGLAGTLLLFLALGRLATPARTLPEFQLVAGWGVACLALTAWGVLTPWSLRWPTLALLLMGVAGAARGGWLNRQQKTRPPLRFVLLTVPLWLVMLSVRPSQIDTWLNLLPNAAYLFDHDLLPTAARPPSYSFLPVAPYNTQFADYLASLASGSFADGAMALFNVALLCAGGLLLARAVTGDPERAPPWWACGVGLLLAGPLNPGFVPRFFVSPYGEAPLAVATLFAVWLSAEMLGDLARGVAWPKAVTPLALILAALVNTKQSGVGSLLPLGMTLLALACADRAIDHRRAFAVIGAALTPALALYLLWRGFALGAGFPAGELKPLPLAEWNVALLPQIILALLVAMFRKATFFLCVAALLVLAVRQLRRAPWTAEGRLLGLISGVIVLFNGFLLFTYVAHFPAPWALRAHSYFRYNTQVSLLLMFGFVVAVRPWIAAWVAKQRPYPERAGQAAIVLALLLPLAGAPLLRFDLDTPQPELRLLARKAAAYLHPGDRLALLLPDDNEDAIGSFLRGLLLFSPPRRPGIDFRMQTAVGPTTLAAAAAADYRLALVTCAPPGLADVPPGEAAILSQTPQGWRALGAWPWPEWITRQPFAAMLARRPLCARPRPG
jgi:hypothetical protein